jgi:uncharacterized delta-60 repeat protein
MWFPKKQFSPAPSHRRAFQPRLERLEDRCLLSGGAFDPTFGTGGVVTTSVASFDASNAYAVATYPNAGTADDGKVVAAGTVSSYISRKYVQDMAVVRYTRDGTLDPSFGGTGEVTTSLGSGPGGASDVKVQPDGKVVVAGWTGGNGSNFALVRYNADGTLDTSFGGKARGVVLTQISNSTDAGWTLALQADGKIVVAGTTAPRNSPAVDLALVRYNADGTLDTNFGTGGKVTRHFSTGLSANIHGGIDLAIDPNTDPLNPNAGKIVVAAQLTQGPMIVVRLNTNGSPDTTFGSNGAGYVSISSWASPPTVGAVAVQSDDRVVVAGCNPGTTSTGADIGLARFNPDGTPDTAFGSGGFVEAPLPNLEVARSLTLQPDGKLVVAGDTELPSGSFQFMVARFNAADGSLETSFGTGGVALTTGFNVADNKVDVALEPDGRIVLAGTTLVVGHSAGIFALARFLATGPVIGSFTDSPNTGAGTVTLIAANVTPLNRGSTVTQVAFYLDSNGDGVLDAGDALLGDGSPSGANTWTLPLSTASLASGTYKLFAQATDSYGASSDPVPLTLVVP